MAGRLSALVVLVGLEVGFTLLATADAANAVRSDAPQPRYTIAATQACLQNLPDTLAGLPPAKSPTPSLFVYRVAPGRLIPPAVGTLWAFKEARAGWQGVKLSFFVTERSARMSARTLLDRHTIARNVVVATETPAATWQTPVLACLQGGVPARSKPRTSPKASLATFVGYWGGHTRGLRISETGRGSETASSGCCMRAYDLSLQITRVTGTVTRATATYRVTRFKRYPTFNEPIMRVGQVGELQLRNGVVTNHQSNDYFCSDPAWEATGVCGA